MNRGILESLPVPQRMTGNPNWWNINSMRPPTHQQQSPFLPSSAHPSLFPPPLYQPPPSSSSLPLNSWHHDNNQELPESWRQLLLGGSVGEVDQRSAQLNHYHNQVNKLENWQQEQILYPSQSNTVAIDVKQEVSEGAHMYSLNNEEFQAARPNWSSHHQVMPASSPKSCVTSFSSNMLDFSIRKAHGRHPQPDHSFECNSTETGGAFKKARVQPCSTQSTFKVRKEKLGDRITALHQLVSPFGKTDTASVLLEATGYIRFLQSQIEALSSPYLGSSGSGNMRQQQCVQGEKNSIFPEDPGQLLNDNSMKKRGIPDQDPENEPKKDLRSRGLCLVPVSCTLQVGSDNGADYWAPTLGGGFR